MTEFAENREPFSDVEALVRAAAGYVRPSETLRPRVLEVARAQRNERRALRRVWHLAVVVVLLGMITTAARTRSSLGPPPPWSSPASPAHDNTAGAAPQGEFGWDTVEAFRQLRRRQAELLRVAM